MNSKLLSLENSKEWNSYLKELPKEQQDIYFTPEYYQLYENLGDGKAQCFVFQSGADIALYPFLINSVNKLGFKLNQEYQDIQGAYGYNGIITSTNQPKFITAFYQEFNTWCSQNNIIAEFTRFHPLLKNHLFSEKNLDVILDRKTVVVNLQKIYSDIFKNFQRTTRKQISRAINRHNLRVERFEKSPDIIEIFYPIYVETMDRVKAETYLYFTKDYFSQLIDKTQSICFVAYREDNPVASIIVFYNDIYIHGHLGGAITKYLDLSAYSFLYDQIIQYGISKSCHYYHVGGGLTNSEDDALLNFKLNFSQQTCNFFIGKKIHNQEVYSDIISQWEFKNPEKCLKHKHYLLKYRY
jgi:lipid II:glycine glycyltransferase (peptidoglycan interpeptide bridge formation enzyme)